MQLVIDVNGGSATDLLDEITLDPRLGDAEVTVHHPVPRQGGLSAVQPVLEFIGTDVLLPVVIQIVYDWVCDHFTSSEEDDPLSVVVTRTDFPDGKVVRKVEISGSADDVIRALRSHDGR